VLQLEASLHASLLRYDGSVRQLQQSAVSSKLPPMAHPCTASTHAQSTVLLVSGHPTGCNPTSPRKFTARGTLCRQGRHWLRELAAGSSCCDLPEAG